MRSLSIVFLCVCLALAGCDSTRKDAPPEPKPQGAVPDSNADGAVDQAKLARDIAPDTPAQERPDPLEGVHAPVSTVPVEVSPDNLHEVPDEFTGVVPRATLRSWHRARNVLHEGNNIEMRGARSRDGKGLYTDSGEVIAARWRRYASGVRGVFVLRDSLFSQQDHPYNQVSFAPMLPPNWVTVAAALASQKQEIVSPLAHDPGDEARWRGADAATVFGSFPVSPSLHEQATRDWSTQPDPELAKARALNARRVLGLLAADVEAMRRAAPFGAEAVAEAGAARLAASDRVYFGEEVRAEKIIPIFVEHPNAKELDEGKGMVPDGQVIDAELARMVTRVVYRARLRDGDLAIERYDLSSTEDRARAIALLEQLIPRDAASAEEPDTKVWLWVTGKLDPKKKLQGEGPLDYVAGFREEVAAARIDVTRLELFGKPTERLPVKGAGRRSRLEKLIAEYRAAGLLYVSVNYTSPLLWNILGE